MQSRTTRGYKEFVVDVSKPEIYTTPTCKYCVQVKEWFKARDIPLKEMDATNPDIRKFIVEKSGQMGVPVTLWYNETIIGFDENKLEELWKKLKT